MDKYYYYEELQIYAGSKKYYIAYVFEGIFLPVTAANQPDAQKSFQHIPKPDILFLEGDEVLIRCGRVDDTIQK